MIARARWPSGPGAHPSTMRSGRIKSSIAAPSFRNSGFETTANGASLPRAASSAAMLCRTRCAVPTAAVDEQLDLACIYIYAEHLIAEFREACTGHQAYITCADDRDFHALTGERSKEA